MSLSKLSLCNLPDVALQNIVENTDFKSIQVLRKVCHNLRNFIDDLKLFSNLEFVEISLEAGKISIEYEFNRIPYKVEYQENEENRCLEIHENQEKPLENQDYLNRFFLDFKQILELKSQNQNSILPFLHIFQKIDFEKPYENLDFNGFYQKFKDLILKNRPRPLGLTAFLINVLEQEHLMSILPYLDSKELKAIRFTNPKFFTSAFQPETIMEFDEIVKLDQWKNAERIEIAGYYLNISIQNCLHFLKVHVSLQSISAEELIMLKETSLHSSNFEYFNLDYLLFEDEYQFLDVLGPPSYTELLWNGAETSGWYFRTPDTEENVLHIIYRPSQRKIEFSRVEISKVPENVIILN